MEAKVVKQVSVQKQKAALIVKSGVKAGPEIIVKRPH